MMRAIVAALFATPTPPSWVAGLGMLALPGVVRDRRHGRQRNDQAPIRSNGKVGDLSGQVSA